MECKNCGYKLKKDKNVCPRCGYSFDLKKYNNKKFASIVGSTLGASGLAAYIVNTVKKIKTNEQKEFIVHNNDIKKVNNDENINTNQVLNENTQANINISDNTTSVNNSSNNINTDNIDHLVINGDTVVTNKEEIKEALINTGLSEKDINRIVTASSKGNIEEVDKVIEEINNNYSQKQENEIINKLKDNGLKDEEISKVIDAHKTGDNSKVSEILNNGNDQNDINDIINDINKEFAQEYEQTIKTRLEENGFTDAEISKVIDAYKTGDQEEFNKVVNEINTIRASEYEIALKSQLEENGFTEAEISKVIDAYKTGDQEKFKEVFNEINSNHAGEYETTLKLQLKRNEFTDEEISKVIDAYKKEDNSNINELLNDIKVKNKTSDIINDINSEFAQEYEQTMKTRLEESGLTNEEASKVIDTYKTGDNSSINEEINEIINDINKDFAQEYEQTMKTRLEENGFTNEEISKIVDAYKIGNKEKFNEIINEIDANHAQEYEQIIKTRLEENGFTNEEISKVIDAYKTGDQEKFNEVVNEINANHPSEYEQIIKTRLEQNGYTNEEIAKVIDSFKTGDGEKINEVINEINASHANEYEQNLIEQLKSSGLNDEEISIVIEAFKTGDENKINEALNNISNKHTSKPVTQTVVTNNTNEALREAEIAGSKEYEEQLINQLKSNDVDENTINRMIEAYRNGDQDGMNAIYAEINTKKENAMRSQLKNSGMNQSQIERIIKAYKNGDQKAINKVYDEIAKSKEDEFIKQLQDGGITNQEDLDAAREAYRSGNQDKLNKTIDRISSSYLNPSAGSDVSIPKGFDVEALLSKFGASSKFTGENITKVSCADVTFDNLRTQFQSISDEYESGRFNKYDKDGVNKFGNVVWNGSLYKNCLNNYYNFLDTLKNDLQTLKNTLMKLEGGELNYYNKINMDMAFQMMDSAGNANVDFYNKLSSFGISNFGDDGIVSESEMVDFNNELFSQLFSYYGDGDKDYKSYDPQKLSVYGKYAYDQVQNYETYASQIAILMNQASSKGLVDLNTIYDDGSGKTLNDFTIEQFNQMCRDRKGNIMFSNLDPMALQLGAMVFNNELSISNSTGKDTNLYSEFINSISSYAKDSNYYLEPTEYAYNLLRSSVQNEIYSSSGSWRLDPNSQTYKDFAKKYQQDCMNRTVSCSFEEYLAQNGYGKGRTNIGNDVVDLFSNVIGKDSRDRLDRSLQYNSNFEESFYLSRQYYDVVGPNFTQAYNEFSNFSRTASTENGYTPLDLYSQKDSAELIEHMKNNPSFSHIVDSNGKLKGDYANIKNLRYDDRIRLQKEMTEAILKSRVDIKNEEYTKIVNQMQLFNTFVSPTYKGSVRTNIQRDGANLYLGYANGKNDIGDYLKSKIVSYDKFINNNELVSKYGDYKTYCYSFDNKKGSRYDEVEKYFKATTNSIEEFNNLNNTFNDNIINTSLNYSNIKTSCNQFHESFLGSMKQNAKDGKLSEMKMEIASTSMSGLALLKSKLIYPFDKEASQKYDDDAKFWLNQSVSHHIEMNKLADRVDKYSDLQSATTDLINNLQHENINFTSKYSYYNDYINQYKEEFKNYKLNENTFFDIKDRKWNVEYEWVDKDGKKLNVSDEQLALMFLMAEKNGSNIKWDYVDKNISKYAENTSYLQKDEKTNYNGVLDYLMFSKINNKDSFSQQFTNISNLGFDTEARRRADEYTSDFSAKMFSKLLNKEFSSNSELVDELGKIGLVSSSIEWLFEDIVLPALYGVDGFIKNIEYALKDTALSVFHETDEIDFNPSVNDQAFSYILQNYKDNGGLDMVNYYVTQASTSIGNQAIPIAASIITGNPYVGLGLLGASAYGNGVHNKLDLYLHDNRDDTDQWDAILYGVVSAGSEMFLEKFLGALPGGISKNVNIGIKGLLKDITGEMVEESLQEFLDPLFNDIANKDVFRAIGKGEFGDYVVDFMDNKVDLEAIRDSAIIAAISSGFMNGTKSGPKIVKSLIMTNGKSSSIVQLLELQAQAMAQAGFTQEQINEQIAINQNAAINNASNLTQIAKNLLSNPSFEAEFNNWRKNLSKKDPRIEFNIDDYASMRAIQSLSFDTTEFKMIQNANNSKISELRNALLKSENIEEINEQLNELNANNAKISEQIKNIQLQALEIVNKNSNTIKGLQSQIEELSSQLETTTEEQKNNIIEQIKKLQLEINSFKVQNNLINLSLVDNLNALELAIDNNNKLLEILDAQIKENNLEQKIIDVLKNQIDIINQEQIELKAKLEPARQSLAKQLVDEESQLLQMLYNLNKINKEDTENLKQWEKSKYQKIQEQIDKVNNRLSEIQNQFESLEQNGITIEGRMTYATIEELNKELDGQVSEIEDKSNITDDEELLSKVDNLENQNNQNTEQTVENIDFEIKGLEITPSDVLSITKDGLNNFNTKLKNIGESITQNLSQFNNNQKAKLTESLIQLSTKLKNMSSTLYNATIGKIISLIGSINSINEEEFQEKLARFEELSNRMSFNDYIEYIENEKNHVPQAFRADFLGIQKEFETLEKAMLKYARKYDKQNSQNVEQTVDEINFEIKGLEITPSDVLSITKDGINNLAAKLKGISESVTQNLSKFSSDQKAKLTESLIQLSTKLKSMSSTLYNATIGKIISLIGSINSINEEEFQEKLARFEELSNRMSFNDYIEYMENEENHISQAFRADFVGMQKEFEALEKAMLKYARRYDKQNSQNIEQTVDEIDFEIKGLEITPGDVLSITKDGINNLATKIKNIGESITQNLSKFSSDQKAKLTESLTSLSNNLKDSIKNMSSSLYEATIGKINSLIESMSNLNINEQELQAKINRYNELSRILDSEDYKKYMENAKQGYAQVLKPEFFGIEKEFDALKKEISMIEKILNKQNSQNIEQTVDEIDFEIKGLEITPGDALSITKDGINNLATKIKNIGETITQNLSKFNSSQKAKLTESLTKLSNNLKDSIKNMSSTLYEATIGKINSLIESIKNSSYNSNQFRDLKSFIEYGYYDSDSRLYYANYVKFGTVDFPILPIRKFLHNRYMNIENVKLDYWTGEINNLTNDTGEFFNIKIGNEPNMPFRNSYKIYVPVVPDNFQRNCTEVLDYLISNNIASENKIANKSRADGFVLRVYDINDAMKVIDYINSNPNISGTITGIPLAKRHGKVALAMDGFLSYNSVVSTLLQYYTYYNYQNRSIEGFRSYVDNILKSVYNQGNIEDLINHFGAKINNQNYNANDKAKIIANYMQVIGLISLSLNENSTINDYLQYCYANQNIENVNGQIEFFKELINKGNVEARNNVNGNYANQNPSQSSSIKVETVKITPENLLQVMQSKIGEVLNTNISGESKSHYISDFIRKVCEQTGYSWNDLMSIQYNIKSLDGVSLAKETITIEQLLQDLSFMDRDNIQNILNSRESYSASKNRIINFIYNSGLNVDELLHKEIQGLYIDGDAVREGVNLNDLISLFISKQNQLEYDIISSEIGVYNNNRDITNLKGLNENEVKLMLELSNLIHNIKNTSILDINYQKYINSISSLLPYTKNNKNIIKTLLSKLRGSKSQSNNYEILLAATAMIGDLKYKMINADVGLVATSSTFDGKVIKVYGRDYQSAQNLIHEFQEYYKILPELAKVSLREVNLFTDFKNPMDDYWALNYDKNINSGFLSAATGGSGFLNLWDLLLSPSNFTFEILCHESGHNIDSMIGTYLFGQNGIKWTDMSGNAWQKAIITDGVKVSDYGEKAIAEDFAESYKRYINDHEAFVKECPNRAALLENALIALNQRVFGENAIDIHFDLKRSLEELKKLEKTDQLDEVIEAIKEIEKTDKLDEVVEAIKELEKTDEVDETSSKLEKTDKLDEVVETIKELEKTDEVDETSSKLEKTDKLDEVDETIKELEEKSNLIEEVGELEKTIELNINDLLNDIKFNFIDSISDISSKITSFNQKIIENYKSLPSDLKNQIKVSMQAAKDYLISISSKIDPKLKSTYDSIAKEIDSILEVLNKPEIEVVSESNGLQLKNSILSSIDQNWDLISKARKAYIELSKAVNYDPRYSLALRQNDLITKGEIYNRDISFRTLEGRDIICKGWSELYRELLIELGFDENDVIIVGGNDLGNHKWVKVDLHDGYVLLADAADVIEGSNDLSNCKIGSKTNGFMKVLSKYAGKRPLEVVSENELNLRKLDNKIGYTKGKMYFDEAYKKYQGKFRIKIFGDKVIKNSLLNMQFSEGMDGTDAYVQMKKICNILFASPDLAVKKPRPLLHYRKTKNGIESVSVITIFDESDGKNKYLLYSKSLGKIVVSDMLIPEFKEKYGLF